MSFVTPSELSPTKEHPNSHPNPNSLTKSFGFAECDVVPTPSSAFDAAKEMEAVEDLEAAWAKERRMIFCAYPYRLDSHGETIRPSAWMGRINTYLKNPIVSFAHNPFDKLPVGKATRVWVEDGNSTLKAGLWCEIEFATHPFAYDLWMCYKGGYMNAVSIMADPHDWDEPGKDFPGQTGKTYTDVELLDISCVPIPANPDALAQRSLAEQPEALVKAWGRVQAASQAGQTIEKAGKEISAANLAAITGAYDDVLKACERLKTIIDRVAGGAPASAEKSLTATEINDEPTASQTDLLVKKKEPSAAASASATREAPELLEDQADQEATPTSNVTDNPGPDDNQQLTKASSGGDYLNDWLKRLGWK